MKRFNIERELQRKYSIVYRARREIKTPVGYIDLLTNHKLYELKNACTWKSGVGQLICYGYFYPTHQKVLCLFNHEKLSCAKKFDITRICTQHNIICKYIS